MPSASRGRSVASSRRLFSGREVRSADGGCDWLGGGTLCFGYDFGEKGGRLRSDGFGGCSCQFWWCIGGR